MSVLVALMPERKPRREASVPSHRFLMKLHIYFGTRFLGAFYLCKTMRFRIGQISTIIIILDLIPLLLVHAMNNVVVMLGTPSK